MYVYGGINDYGKKLSDVWEFDILTEKWTDCRVKLGENIKENFGLAYHSMIAIYEKGKQFEIYRVE